MKSVESASTIGLEAIQFALQCLRAGCNADEIIAAYRSRDLRTEQIQELLAAAQELLDWVPICSEGSSGDLRQKRLKRACKAIERESAFPDVGRKDANYDPAKERL